METKGKFWVIGIFVLSIFLINFVSAESVEVSDVGVEYDSELIEIYNNLTFAEQNRLHNATNYETLKIINNEVWLKVIVRLKDNSGIIVEGTKEERKELIEQKEEWFKPRIDEVLSTLSEKDIRVAGKSSDGFDGLISEEGFEKLINDDRIKEIIWPKTGFKGHDKSILNDLYLIILFIVLIIIISYFIIRRIIKKRK